MEDSIEQFASNQSQAHQQIAQSQLYNLGIDNLEWPAFTDYKQILEQLKTGDEMIIYEAMINLSSQLSMAQENTLSSFPLDQYIPVLIEILKRPPATDLANEINMFVIQCLTNLMDIFPTVCGTIVNHGAVKSLAEVLERSMGFIDLNDACIKCIDKISMENPYAILTSGAIGLCLNMMDFFEIPTQKKILNLTQNVSRHSASEQDLNDFIIPVIPCLCQILQSRGDHATAKIESVVNITLKICESIMRFYSPANNFEKITTVYETIGSTGIIDGLLQKLQDYCISDDSQMMLDNQIQQTQQIALSNSTVQNILKILTHASRYSSNLTKLIIEYDIFRLIEQFLPSKDDIQKIHVTSERFPFVMETISLIDTLLPEREESIKGQNEKAKLKIEIEKKGNFNDNSKVLFLAEKLLPKIFFVFENNIQALIRNKTLQIIDKMILLFNDELLNNFIEPYSFAKFIYSNLRQSNLSSIQLCLQMVDKLMKSNPKTYTLPLMREGVTSQIGKFKDKESLEKALKISLTEEKASDKQKEKSEEFLIRAKQAILAKGESYDKEAQLHFEQSIQKYLEASKISQLYQQNSQSKTQVDSAKQIIALAQPLIENFFENEAFSAKLSEWYGEEFKTINMLRNLSKDIVQEAQQEGFNFERTKNLLKQVARCLTSKKQVMSYEFKESGLLEALELFLTHSPKQVQLISESEKIGEEVKHSEEMQLCQMKKSSQQIKKKEARSYIQRLKTFAHVVLSTFDEKKPIQELINLCHELLSQSEYQIFDNQQSQDQVALNQHGIFSSSLEDPNQQVTALRQLTKRTRVNLVYDPQKKFMKEYEEKGEKGNQSQLKQPPLQIEKSKSHHPAFQHLAEQSSSQASSKVYIKRNFLYQELQQVLISVEQCASLYILEDFLRSKIRTMEDVKALKTPQSFYTGLKKGGAPTYNAKARQIIDKAMDKIRVLMESGCSREKIRQDGDEFAESMCNEILEAKELNEVEQIEIIKYLEMHIFQMIDEIYADQESQYEDMMRDELIEGEDEEFNPEQKMYEFQKTIETLRLLFRQKKEEQKAQEKAKVQQQKSASTAQKTEEEEDTEMKQEDKQVTQPKLEKQLALVKEGESQNMEEEQKQAFEEEKKEDDVDMTDEEDEYQRKLAEMIEKKKIQTSKKALKEVELSVQDNNQQDQQKETINMDLDELIKASGDDIEFEFYFNGQLVGQNQTIFEILRQQEKKEALGSLYYREPTGNIYFLIKDKKDDLTMQRKDSLLEFAQKRERTKSEAVDDISVSAVNQFVQQLIDKEFQVLSKDTIQDSQNKEKSYELKHLEQALKILKVLNFICKNTKLLSNQGLKFIINQYDDEQQKDEMFQDLTLQIGVSELHQNIFHHHKLDTFILKNIQDPYTLIGGGISDILQQIFKNCPFLFPFQTRQLFFKLISFIGSIDMNRSIYFLRQFLKQRLGKLPQEDKNIAVKFQKQKFIVDRTKIIESAMSLMKQINKRAFLEIQYKEEAGTGLGPTLEFYYLVSNEIRKADVQIGSMSQLIWRKGMADQSMFPAPVTIHKMRNDELQKLYEMFRLTGMIIAKSISDDRLIDLPLSSLFWDLLLGKKMNIFDLERIDTDLYKIFAELQILANKKKEIEKQTFLDEEAKVRQLHSLRTSDGARVEDLSLTFTLPGYDHIELMQNGKSTYVTLHNLQEYIDLVMHFTFHESIKIQLQAFKKGFNAIFPIDSLKAFSSIHELEDMICGVQKDDDEWTNITRLTENVIPLHGFHSKSKEYMQLLKFMGELNLDERRKFLKFVTGSPRLPNGGFAALDPKLTVVHKKPFSALESPDDILPSVMTCQNFIKLPSYSSYDKFKERFQMAYTEGTNNFTLS